MNPRIEDLPDSQPALWAVFTLNKRAVSVWHIRSQLNQIVAGIFVLHRGSCLATDLSDGLITCAMLAWWPKQTLSANLPTPTPDPGRDQVAPGARIARSVASKARRHGAEQNRRVLPPLLRGSNSVPHQVQRTTSSRLRCFPRAILKARELQADESGEVFERAFKRLVPEKSSIKVGKAITPVQSRKRRETS